MDSLSPILPLHDGGLARSKRRRLISKQASTSYPLVLQQVVDQTLNAWVGFPTPTEFRALQKRSQYYKVFNKFVWWLAGVTVESCVATDYCATSLLAFAQKQRDSLSKAQRNAVVRYFIEVSKAPEHVQQYAAAIWSLSREQAAAAFDMRGHSFLLTYQGDWFLLGNVSADFVHMSNERLTSVVSQDSRVQDKIQTFQRWADVLVHEVGANSWACSVEICLKSLRQKRELRLHSHLFIRNDTMVIRILNKSRLLFQKCMPYVTNRCYGRQMARNAWSGAYYCQCPKLGSVYSAGSHERGIDYMFNPDWVNFHLEQGKMTYAMAKVEHSFIVKGYARRLSDLESWHRNKQEEMIQGRIWETQQQLEKQLAVFPRWPLVDAWLQEVSQPHQLRKRFLVLDGPSRLGKTQFVRSLFSMASVLELNCAGVTSVCLGSFDVTKHQCLLWDEASPVLILSNRKIFQHQPTLVDLGHSPTGSHVVRVYLGNCCSVITSNSWQDDARKLSRADQDWLDVNAVVFSVVQPLWLPQT